MKMDWKLFGFAIGLCFLAAVFGSFFTVSAVGSNGWYQIVQKPEWTPANQVFGPVWTFLYFLMGIAIYRVWKYVKGSKKKLAEKIFYAQLFLNAIWSFFFFGLRDFFLGFVNILLLWIFIVWTIWEFWKIDRKSAVLLFPYLVWVTIASVLNYTIWQLNL